MDKKEFLEKLAMALAGQVSGRVIEENIAYYDQYISDEVRRGKPVSQVLEELGDPRLIARSIIEANGAAMRWPAFMRTATAERRRGMSRRSRNRISRKRVTAASTHFILTDSGSR